MVLRDDPSCAYAPTKMGVLARHSLIVKKKPSPCEGREGCCKANRLLTSIHVPYCMGAACSNYADPRSKEGSKLAGSNSSNFEVERMEL